MKRYTTCFLSLLVWGYSQAQHTTHIGADIAFSADILQLRDPGGRLSNPEMSAALWGVSFRHVVKEHLILESGVYTRAYKVGLAFDGGYGSSGTDRTGVLVPFRAGVRLPLWKGRLAICPVGGLTIGITDEGYENGSEGVHDWQDSEPIPYRYTVQHSSQVFSLLQAGLGIDIKLGSKSLLSLSSHYYHGLSKMMTQHIEYTPGNGIPVKSTQHSRGGFYSIGIGYRHTVDWFKK